MTEKKPPALPHLVRRPSAGGGAPPLLVLLHGFGSNEQDLFGMAPYLDRRLLIVSLRAPYTLGPGSYAWFELGYTPTGVVVDPRQIEASVRLVVESIGEAVAAYDADPRRVYLMGFSQGAMLSGWIALTRPDLVAGAVLMSGRIEPEMLPLIASPEQLKGMPILMTHGVLDQVLPIQFGRASRDILARLPVELTYREYQMGHEVNTQSLTDVVTWLSARLDGA